MGQPTDIAVFIVDHNGPWSFEKAEREPDGNGFRPLHDAQQDFAIAFRFNAEAVFVHQILITNEDAVVNKGEAG